MGLVPEGDRPKPTLAEKVKEGGYAYAYHNIVREGRFTPPPGTEAIALGLPDPLVPTVQFFVYDPERLEVLVVESGETDRYFYANAHNGGYEMTSGLDTTVAFRTRR